MANNQSKKSRKAGRNEFDCKAYKNENRREKNKLRRLQKHLKEQPNDPTALAAVEVCKKAIRGY